MNLTYAKWLQLPIKQMEEPQKLLNIDGTENKGNPDRIPTTSEGIQRRGIATITPSYHLGSCSRTTPGSPYILAWTTSPSNTKRDRRGTKVCSRTPEKGHHPRIMESICSKLLLRQKERRQASTGTRLLTNKQMDEKKPQYLSSYSPNHRPSKRVHTIHQV